MYICTDRICTNIAVHIYIVHVSLHIENIDNSTLRNGSTDSFFADSEVGLIQVPFLVTKRWCGTVAGDKGLQATYMKSGRVRCKGCLEAFIHIYHKKVAGDFKHFLFSPLFGEDSHFD